VISDWFWGPQSPSEFDFFIPKDGSRRTST